MAWNGKLLRVLQDQEVEGRNIKACFPIAVARASYDNSAISTEVIRRLWRLYGHEFDGMYGTCSPPMRGFKACCFVERS